MKNLFTESDSYLTSVTTKVAPWRISQGQKTDAWSGLRISCWVQL